MCAAPVTRSARHHPSPAVALRPKHGGPTGPSMRDTARNHPIRRPLPGVAPECAGRVRWPARREQRACGSRLGPRAAGPGTPGADGSACPWGGVPDGPGAGRARCGLRRRPG
ncbi:hypothetical protein SFR_4566 [Streptomyces sp. FR-008]|nr:hypothetical protein SFR_4566 [Streptomyces sp. FR-008]